MKNLLVFPDFETLDTFGPIEGFGRIKTNCAMFPAPAAVA